MALSKQIVSSRGVTTNYHKIEHVSLKDNTLSCFVESYVDSDYRAKEAPAESEMFRFEITVEEEESMGIRQLAYGKIKALPYWEDAIDC